MVATPSPISLYATRWKAFLLSLFFTGFLVVDLLYYFVWPIPSIQTYPWAYQEPGKTIGFIFLLVTFAPLTVLGLYWTLTPRPLLQLSSTSLVYRPFPRPTRTISWDDVERITAVAPQTDTSQKWTPVTTLTIWFTFKPHRLLADQAQQRLQLDINLRLLSLSADELLQLMRNYHEVQSLQTPRKSKAARNSRRHDDTSSEKR